MIIQSDSLEFLKSIKDYENDIIYADPPYALGSEIIVRPDGKIDYKKASDFMNKWEMPTGEYWEHWFKEAYRTLKHGGYLLMFGMDRQLLLFKYYAHLAGFQEQQSIYWYYISNFPKATDLSKMIDKNAGAERNIIATRNDGAGNTKGFTSADDRTESGSGFFKEEGTEINITEPAIELAKKYEGYKYSISPLKQTCETIMVFSKPKLTGSVLHDTLAMENGDDTITCSALNIDGNRVGTESRLNAFAGNKGTGFTPSDNRDEKGKGMFNGNADGETETTGRYPAQTFIDSRVAEKLDLQSGNLKQSTRTYNDNGKDTSWFAKPQNKVVKGDIGGCSKILHKCDYEQIDFDLFIYQPKVSIKERNAGCDEFEDKTFYQANNDHGDLGSFYVKKAGGEIGDTQTRKNNHPTLKPIALNEKILRLFKTPNNQKICYPFAGAGSEIIGGIKAGFDNWTACELNQDYVNIANARIEYWTKQKNMVNDIKSTSKINEVVEKGQLNLFDLMGDN